MAITALHTASTGLSALSREIDVIANNLANVNTHGFKAMRANFEDLLYQEVQAPGVENANGDQRPAGTYVGLGTRISNTQPDFSQGDAIETNRPLDMMVDGKGFFRVRIPEDQGAIGYTRAGNFFTNANGELVLGSATGPRLEPGLEIPEDFTSVRIDERGEIYGVRSDSTQESLGQLELATFVNHAGLRPIGGNLFVETPASGPPVNGVPGEGGFGSILQGFLESSNVDSVKELVGLIKTQRAFEMNSQAIQAADQTLQVVSNLRR